MQDRERNEIERDVYVSLREYFHALRAEDRKRIDERFTALDKALELQAAEYARRLHALNGEYQRDRQRQAGYVATDKYEAGIKAEAEARARETMRMNERFDDYLEMYEKRHRELEDEVRARTPQAQFDDYKKAESSARATALLRVDEKFDDYVKRYEIRQREVDLLLAAQAGAADEARRAVEDQGRKSNRNLGIASLVLGMVVFAANIIPVLVK